MSVHTFLHVYVYTSSIIAVNYLYSQLAQFPKHLKKLP